MQMKVLTMRPKTMRLEAGAKGLVHNRSAKHSSTALAETRSSKMQLNVEQEALQSVRDDKILPPVAINSPLEHEMTFTARSSASFHFIA